MPGEWDETDDDNLPEDVRKPRQPKRRGPRSSPAAPKAKVAKAKPARGRGRGRGRGRAVPIDPLCQDSSDDASAIENSDSQSSSSDSSSS